MNSRNIPLYRFRLVVCMLFILSCLCVPVIPSAAAPVRSDVAYDMVDSTALNVNDRVTTGDLTTAGDMFGIRSLISPGANGLPYAMQDASPDFSDAAGIILDDALGDGGLIDPYDFFGAVDTVSSESGYTDTYTWTFDISGATDLELSIDFAAMGDFETADAFNFTYSIDGAPAAPVFTIAVNDTISHTYTSLQPGGFVTDLDDPMTVNGVVVDNNFTTASEALSGTGSELTLTFTAETDGGSEAFAFRDIIITGLVREDIAYDMVDSTELNVDARSTTGDLTSAGDMFGIRSTISPGANGLPYAMEDTSPDFSDAQGIILDDALADGGLVDPYDFFGVVDTVSSESGHIDTYTWTFNIGNATDLKMAIDFAAMGDFETADALNFTYSIDGAPSVPVFAITVNEAISQTYYSLQPGGFVTDLDDPLSVNGVLIDNDFTTITETISGTGAQLVLTFTADADGGSEAFAFRDIVISGIADDTPSAVRVQALSAGAVANDFLLASAMLISLGIGSVLVINRRKEWMR